MYSIDMKLTKDQKEFISKNYLNIPDLILLTRAVFNNESLDGRSREGKVVAEYMVQQKYKYKTRARPKKPAVRLGDDQKEEIVELAKGGLKSFSIAQIIFPDREIKNLGLEQRAVSKFLKKHSPDFVKAQHEEGRIPRYIPPSGRMKLVAKINERAMAGLDPDNLKRREIDYVTQLGKYLRSPRFCQIIVGYGKDDAHLFEAEFIRAVWDKPDLTNDEINLYINVCIDYVNLKNINRNMEKLNRMFDEAEDQTEMTVRLAEILKAKSGEYHQCEQRQESLIKRLNGDRAMRLKSKRDENASMLSLVQAFQEEEERKLMLDMAEKQKLLIAHEATTLENMDSWKARVLGIDKSDVI